MGATRTKPRPLAKLMADYSPSVVFNRCFTRDQADLYTSLTAEYGDAASVEPLGVEGLTYLQIAPAEDTGRAMFIFETEKIAVAK